MTSEPGKVVLVASNTCGPPMDREWSDGQRWTCDRCGTTFTALGGWDSSKLGRLFAWRFDREPRCVLA